MYSENGGCIFSRRVLIEHVLQHFGGEMLPLHFPGMATLLAFMNHVATNLRLIDDDQNDDIDNSIGQVGRQILKETRALKRDFKCYDSNIN